MIKKFHIRKPIKLKIHFLFGIILGFTFISCNSRKPNHFETEIIVSKSIEEIIKTDTLRFFAPLILVDGLDTDDTISAINEKRKQQYEVKKQDFINISKYVVLPDSVELFYKKSQHIELVDISGLKLKRYYEFITNSKTKKKTNNFLILAEIKRLKIEFNDIFTNAILSYSLNCAGAETGGWSGSITLEKKNNDWNIIQKNCP